jgi:tetratricopeptide (TPR) repeat protein
MLCRGKPRELGKGRHQSNVSELLAVVVDRLIRRWHHPSSWAIASLIAATLLSYSITSSWTVLPKVPAVVVSLALIGAIPTFWFVQHRVPRAAPGKVGIVVAIATERHSEERQIQNDLIAAFRQRLAEAPSRPFDLIVLPSYRAEGLVDVDSAKRMLDRTRSIYMVYGSARWRELGGKSVPHLFLEGLVRHLRVTPEAEQDLLLDFKKNFPRRLVLRQGELFGFEITSEWIDLTTRYILGVAAFLAGDAEYSEALLLSTEQRLRMSGLRHAPLREMARRLPRRLIALYEAWLGYLADRYFITRDRNVLELSDTVADKLLDRDLDHYPALLMKAICAFELRGDVAGAKQFIHRCRGQKDATWRYSMAFLLAYEGKLDQAVAEYERAFKARVDNVTVPIQSEEFIQNVLSREPDRIQLLLCLAMLNDRAKGDPAAARRDYDAFIRAATERGLYGGQVDVARKALARLGS